MIIDGLWCAMNDYHMGTTAENIADQFKITKDEQDEFAVASQSKTENAQKNSKFDKEIVTIEIASKKKPNILKKMSFQDMVQLLKKLIHLNQFLKKMEQLQLEMHQV